MSTQRIRRTVRTTFDRILRVTLSTALVMAYTAIPAVVAPSTAVAAPAALSVSASVSSRPLLGGRATVHVTVRNTDTTDKAYNISVADVLSSGRVDPQGRVTFVSASDGNGALVPTAQSTNAGTGDTTITFVNIRDLAPQETYEMDLVVDLSGDASWEAGDLLNNAVTASGNTIPNQTIPDINASTTASARVLPIIIRSKAVHQSTGVEQATGTGARAFYYTIDVQNNYTGPSQSVVVTDTIPDGIEYLGPHGASPTPDSVSRDASTGVTTLVWDLGTVTTSASRQLAYDAGIRYDYYGTNNGGVNRADTSTPTSSTAGEPIIKTASAKKTFTNTAELGASWLSNPASDTAHADVTGAALTVDKSADKSSGGLGTTINYTLNYATSEYYSAIATDGLTLVHDHLPDGQVLETATAIPAPSSISHNPDGSTDVTWTVGAVPAGGGGSITFAARVDTSWENPGYPGDPIVSGDSMVNSADISGVASDTVNPARPEIPTGSSDNVGFSTHLPTINKYMRDPANGLWSKNVTMTVGDTSTVRVRFNTTNGSTPEYSDINMGNIQLADWLPAGMSIIDGTFNVTYSDASDFATPSVGSPPPLNISAPETITIGGVQGVSWYLGNVAPDGWWEATFDVRIEDAPEVADGTIVANLWKLTGVNTVGTPYSARDMAMANYAEPHLTLDKTVTPPGSVVGGSAVPYRLTIDNTAGGSADRVSIIDTLPVGMRATAPAIDTVTLDGSPLAEGSDYVSAWDGGTGALTVNLLQGAAHTPVPGGSRLRINYTATVDTGIAANCSLANTATVGYSTRATADGRETPGTTNVADDNTDNATVQTDGLTIAKSGPAGPFTLGEVLSYDLDVTVPAHEIAYWPSVVDKLSHEGFVATGTPTIATLSGTPVTGASFASTATAPVRSVPGSGRVNFTFDLNDAIDNSASNQPYVFRVHFDVQYTGIRGASTWEFQPPATTDSFTDSATVSWNSVAAAVRTTNSSANSGSVTTSLQQPLLRNVKTVTSPGPYAGGSTIDYQLVITNPGSSRAYGPSIVDTLPAASADVTITSLSLTGTSISAADITSWSATPTMRVGFDPSISVGTTQTLTVRYRVTLSSSLGAGVAFTNTADVNWSSLPGAPGGSRVYNDSAQENWTQDTSTQTRNAATVTLSKRGPAGPIRIGDVVTYSIDATVPANTVAWYPVISDTMNQRGVSYISNSATITTRANPPSVPAVLAVNSTPTITLTAPSNTVYTWTLPNAIDNSGNSQPYAFTLTFQARVTGLNVAAWDYWPATGAQSISDSASFRWRDVSTGGPATNRTVNSAAVATPVRQPRISATKTILTPGPLTGGSAVDYQVVLANTSGFNTAYDISVTDTLPVEVSSASLTGATLSGVGSILASLTTDFSNLPTSSVTFDSDVTLGTTQTITLTYHAQLAPSIGVGAPLTNNVDVNWSTMPGAVTGERVFNDPAQEAAWTADTTSVSTATPPAVFSKAISGATTGTIGSAVVYSLVATIPANETAYSLVMTDTVSDRLTVLAAGASLPGAVTVGTPGPTGTLVTYNGGDIAGTATPTTVTVTIFAQVRDFRYSGPAVPSGAIANSALLTWRTLASGGTTLSAPGGPVSFTVMQPSLTVTKTASHTQAGPGDVVTYASTITNTGNSPAYEMRWCDVASASMSTPTLVAVKPSWTATLVAGTDYSTASETTSFTVLFDQPASPQIDPGNSVTITWTSSVLAGAHSGASMADTATVASYTSLPATSVARVYPSVSATRSVTALSPALVTSKVVVGNAYPLPGDTVHFRYTVRNVGSAPAYSVSATDTLPANLTYVAGSTVATWPLGSSNSDPDGGSGPTVAWPLGAQLNAGQTLALNFDALVSSSAPTGTVVNTATAGATDALGSPIPANCASWVTSDTDTLDRSTAWVRIVQPGVAVAKVLPTGGDQYAQVGQQVGFRLTVTNTGDTTLTTVPLTDTYNATDLQYISASQAPSSAGGGTVHWNSFGTIAPGASRSVTVTFTVLVQPASKLETDYASVTGVTDEFGHTLPSTQDTATVTITRPEVSVTKVPSPSWDTTIQVGGFTSYHMTVTNTGDTTLTTVPLTDTYVVDDLFISGVSILPNAFAPGAVTWNLGPLAPGASQTVQATFGAIAIPAGNISTDTATVAGAVDEHGDSPSNVATSAHVAITHPAVSVAKTLVGDGEIQVGENATFRLNVTNTGDTTLSSIALSDAWDASALGSPVATSAGTYGAGSANWTLASPLAPGASTVVTLTLTAFAVPSGQVTTDAATVSATDEYGDSAPGGNSSASVRITHPAVAVNKALHTGQDPVVQAGQGVTYDITVTNTGDTTLTTVPLTETYDNAALAYVSASITASSVAGGVAAWNNTGALAPGASRTVRVTFNAIAVPSGQVTTDTAAVSGATDQYGDHPADVNADASVRITAPRVTVTKTLASGQDAEVQPGQSVTFDLAITNSGDTTLTSGTIADTWDSPYLAYLGATAPPFVTLPGYAAWSIPGAPLAPGATTTVTVTFVALACPPGLTAENRASAFAQDVYADIVASPSSAASVMITQPSVTVDKSLHTGQDAVVQAGDTVTFDLSITNNGNSQLATVPISDTFDSSALTFSSASVAPTSVGAGTLSWSDVGPIAVGATRVITVTFAATAVPAGQVTVDSLACTGTVDVYGDPAADASDSASVRITRPEVSVVKALHTGQDTAVQAGEPVTFDITVTNTGDTTLTAVPLADTYDAARLTFSGAMPVPDSTGAGSVHWNDLGGLAPGASVTVVASFSAVSNPPGQITTDTAVVSGAADEYGDSPADASGSAAVKVTRPALALSKTLAPAQDLFIQTGQTVTFNLTVTNTGDTTLTAVPLADSWDATYLQYASASVAPSVSGAGFASWTLGPIAPGASSTVDLTLIALGPVPSHLTTDLATVSGATDENSDLANDDASSAAISITDPALAITKQLHAGQDTAIQAGQTVTYDIGITNIGSVALAHMPLADEFDPTVFSASSASPAFDSSVPGLVTWNDLGGLAPSATTTVTVTFTALAASGGAASVDTATVSGATDVNGDPEPEVSATAGELVTRPEISLTKSLAPGQPAIVRLGSPVAYDIVVTNTGDTTLTTVPLADLYDNDSSEYLTALTAPSAVDTDGLLVWDNVASSPLAPGARITTRVNFRALTAGAEQINVGFVTPGATDTNGDSTPIAGATDDSLAVYNPASLAVTKTADPAPGTILLPSQLITYTLSWENSGTVTIPGAIATDPLPDSVIYVPGSMRLAGAPLTDAADADAGAYDSGSRTVSANLGDVSTGTTGTLTFQVAVAPENLSAKGVANTAVFSSQGSTVATAGPVYHPVDPITIVKTGKDVNGGALRGGDTIEWTITVANVGLSPTTHVVITDTVPNTTTYVKGSIRGRGANDSRQPYLAWDIGTMAVGEAQVVKFRSKVKKGLPTGTRVRNQATVSSDSSRPKRSDNPRTSTAGDPTVMVLKTSGTEDLRLILAVGLMLMLASMWIIPRRRRLARMLARVSTGRKAGDRDA